MFPSIFSDELGLDIAAALPIIKGWGLKHVDLRGRVFGTAAEALPAERLPELKKLLADHGMKVGCLQSSLAKIHLPDAAARQAEAAKLEGIIRAAEALDCRLVRAFFYWQPKNELAGELAVRPDEQQKVLDAFAPLAARAKAAGLTLAFENCGVTPDEVLVIVDALGVPSWGLAWDVANDWGSAERQTNELPYIRRLAQHARLIHVKARGSAVPLDGALIPYDKVLEAASRAGVRGPVSAETHNPDRSVSNTDMSERVVRVIQKAWPTAAPGGLFDEVKSTAGITRAYVNDPVRFVVVGLGMGHNRAKTVHTTPGCKLMGVCDLVEARAKRTGDECGVPYTTDVRPWLDRKDVEVIYVMTETGNHGAVAMQALNAGKHVLSTKPMEASLTVCDQEIRLADEKKLILGIDFDRRFKTDNHTLKSAIAKGRFGKLFSGTAALKILRTMDYFKANGGWRGTKRYDGGGVLSNQSIHHIDDLAFCVGIPARVRASIWTQNHAIEAEDLGAATWLYADGTVITFFGTTNYPHPTWYYHLELLGEKGAYFQAVGGPFEKPMTKWYLDGAWSEQPPEVVSCEWLSAADNFASAVRLGTPLMATGRDGRRSQSIMDAMYRSAYTANGGWVDVAPDLK